MSRLFRNICAFVSDAARFGVAPPRYLFITQEEWNVASEWFGNFSITDWKLKENEGIENMIIAGFAVTVRRDGS